MGLLDKVKNLFTDEEIIEEEEEDTVKIREVKKEEPEETKEHKLPTFMREKIEKEEKKENKEPNFALDEEEKIESPKNISKVELSDNTTKDEEEKKFKFPIEFEESDFIETRSSRKTTRLREEPNNEDKQKNPMHETVISKETKVAKLYKDKKTEKEEERKFKATPIISPVYGVLEKNYQADEVLNTTDNYEKQRPSKNVDFDSVRKKAYGSLAEDIKENLMCENCEYLKEVKECHKRRSKEQKENTENELMYDIIEENNEEENDITLETATENYYDYGKEYEHPTINNSYVDEQSEKVITEHIENNKEEKNKKEVPPVKSRINLLSTLKKSIGDEEEKQEDKKNLELTDDLFNLIDSMYEERDEK